MTTVATNLATNPSVEVTTTGWAPQWWGPSGAGTVARTADIGYRGVYAYRKTWTAAADDADTGFGYKTQGLTPGRFYAFSVTVRASKPTAMAAYVYWLDATGARINGPLYLPGWSGPLRPTTPTNTWVTITGVMQMPATGATGVEFIFGAYSIGLGTSVGSWAPGDTHDADAVLIAEVPALTSPVPAYFDGDTADSNPDYYSWTGTPHASTSTHIVSAGVRINQTIVTIGGPGDVSCYVDRVTMRHGRDDYGEQPEADSITLEMSVDHHGAAVPAIEVGADVTVTHQVVDIGAVFTRFRGRVSDVSRSWDEAGEDTPDMGTCQVVAVSSLGELGRRLVGDQPWPQELDGARVLRVLQLAYPTLPAVNVDPGIYQVVARDVDRKDALSLIQDTADAGAGVLWTKAGDPFPHYADFEHRRGTVAALELDACDILASPTWTRDLSGLCNYVSLTYGLDPVDPPDGAPTEAPSLTSRNQASVDKYGEYGLSARLELANQADAQARASLLTTRNGTPAWVLSDLPLDMAGLSTADVETILGLDMHALILLTGLPAGGSAPTSAYAWIEGWNEVLAAGVHDLTLAVSAYCATAPPVRWDDMAPAETWDQQGTRTWDSIVCVGPIPSSGRWADVPATLRWDEIPPATTWDTWTGG